MSFINHSLPDSRLFIANRVVDILFGLDVLVNFNLAFFDKDLGWVTRRGPICRYYLRGFAIVDIVSTVPYDVIVSGETGSLRNLKVLRLIKLLRIVRSTRVIRRLADQFAIHYSYLTLFNFAVSTMLLAHWMASYDPRVNGPRSPNRRIPASLRLLTKSPCFLSPQPISPGDGGAGRPLQL